MWLLDVLTRELKHFISPKEVRGGYAILSHTWGEQEPTFDDLHFGKATSKLGYQKIEYTCRQAHQDGYEYAWVDTVCIDKRSSAELSEAINSMFNWYRFSKKCYVYLDDVQIKSDDKDRSKPLAGASEMAFRQSRWFTRSWTLQELVAPITVLLFDREWQYLGDKLDLEDILHDITRIDPLVLKFSKSLSDMSVAKRMSWAASRSASREEDHAYALLGLFDIAMPMLYGEGGTKAFRRLQEEIIQSSAFDDHSILAWLAWPGMLDDGSCVREPNESKDFPSVMSGLNSPCRSHGLLSPSPVGFRHAQNMTSWASSHLDTFQISHNGLRLSIHLKPITSPSPDIFAPRKLYLIALRCRFEDQRWRYVTLTLSERPMLHDWLIAGGHRAPDERDALYDVVHFDDEGWRPMLSIHADDLASFTKRTITIGRDPPQFHAIAPFVQIRIATTLWTVADCYPKGIWHVEDSMLKLSSEEEQGFEVHAAIEVSSPQRTHSSVVIVVKIHDKLPYVKLCTSKPGTFVDLALRQEDIEQWVCPCLSTKFSFANLVVNISPKFVLISGERLWSFELTFKEMGRWRPAKTGGAKMMQMMRRWHELIWQQKSKTQQ